MATTQTVLQGKDTASQGELYRRREEPLVAADGVDAAPPTAVQWRGRGGVGAHVRAALLLGHVHADVDRPLVA